MSGLLQPVRGWLALAITLAGTGQMLALLPLAGVAYLAKEVIAGRTAICSRLAEEASRMEGGR